MIEEELEVALDTSTVSGRGTFDDTYQQISSQIGESDFGDNYQTITQNTEANPGTYEDDPISDMKASLAIAAYERTILSNKAPFQTWLRGEQNAMTLNELRGALFFQ